MSSAAASVSDAALPLNESSLRFFQYLSEGKLNIVFSAAEIHHLSEPSLSSEGTLDHPNPWVGRVLKLNKGVLQEWCASYGSDHLPSAEDMQHKLIQSQLYTDRIMRPLFAAAAVTRHTPSSSSAWIDRGELIWITPELIRCLFAQAAIHRSEKRRRAFDFASAISSTPQFAAHLRIPALIFEDYTSPYHLHLKKRKKQQGHSKAFNANKRLPPTLCIELKPKWVYLPSLHRDWAQHLAALQSQSNSGTKLHESLRATALKFHVCRFCMYQHLKVSLKEVDSHSSFCPLDLFSGSRVRVKRALKALMQTPQNNFRLFVRGLPQQETGVTNGANVLSSREDVQLIDFNDPQQVEQVVSLLFPHRRPQMSACASASASASTNANFTSSSSSQSSSSSSSASSSLSSSSPIELLQDFLTEFLCSSASSSSSSDQPTPFRNMFRMISTLQTLLDPWDIQLLSHQLRESKLLVPLSEASVSPAEMSLDSSVLNNEKIWQGLESSSSDSTTLDGWLKRILNQIRDPSINSPSPVPPVPVSPVVADASEPVADAVAPASPLTLARGSEEDELHRFTFSLSAAQRSDARLQSPAQGEDMTPLCAHWKTDFSQQPLDSFIASANSNASSVGTTSPASSDISPCSNLQDCPSRLMIPPADSTAASGAQWQCRCALLQRVRAFLLATTLKDLSIMTTIQVDNDEMQNNNSTNHNDSHAPDVHETHVHYSTRLIDLETKSAAKLPEYYRLDQQILQHYLAVMQKPPMSSHTDSEGL